MAASRTPYARVAAVLVAGAGVWATPIAGGLLRDAPVVWYADDMRTIPAPADRDPNIIHAAVDATFFRPMGRLLHPGRFIRRVGTAFGGDHVQPAGDINVLDEVPNSSWFTNRIGLFPMAPEQAARGPAVGPGPVPPWTLVSAKTEGVTPGFNIRDANGQIWVIKFDSRGNPSMASAAGVISNRIFHAAGYNVPDDRIVTFARGQISLDDDVEIDTADGTRPMREDDLDALLASVEGTGDGRWRALASKFLSGRPLGPFDWKGRRPDDPNDRIDHENRRELRGLAVFAAWLCHYDTKQGNTLDMFVAEDGRQFVRHYLIDFASTLGAGGRGPFPAACSEYSFDLAATFVRALSLGLYEDPWRRLRRPDSLPEIGYFESDVFTPADFKPLEPNTAFANLTDRDGYWAAKIISAFTNEHLGRIVSEGQYHDPAAAVWMVRVLAERRDAITRYWFARIPPLDFFAFQDGTLGFRDLGVERGIFGRSDTRYRVRVAQTGPTRDHGRWSEWIESTRTEVVLPEAPVEEAFLAVETQVHRGSRWSTPVALYVARRSGRVVALER